MGGRLSLLVHPSLDCHVLVVQVSELRQELDTAQASLAPLADLKRRSEQGARVASELRQKIRDLEAQNEAMQVSTYTHTHTRRHASIHVAPSIVPSLSLRVLCFAQGELLGLRLRTQMETKRGAASPESTSLVCDTLRICTLSVLLYVCRSVVLRHARALPWYVRALKSDALCRVWLWSVCAVCAVLCAV